MGMKGREIVERAGVDVNTLIKLLNQAYCDEWLSYYQYWIGAKVAEGIYAKDIAAELEEHAHEELEHAEKLAKRIMELDGTPISSPTEWLSESTCGYLTPTDKDAMALLKQNLQSERCAIEVYNRILERLRARDLITDNLIRSILADEVEHENDLEAFFPPKSPKTGK